MGDTVMVLKVIEDGAPILGVYSGVEAAQAGWDSRGLIRTGVLCLLSELR
jgi:hypothetical protein